MVNEICAHVSYGKYYINDRVESKVVLLCTTFIFVKSVTIQVLLFIIPRLPGVYGPKEDMIVRRSLAYLESRTYSSFVCYNKNLHTDFVHIRNVIQAHIKVFCSMVS